MFIISLCLIIIMCSKKGHELVKSTNPYYSGGFTPPLVNFMVAMVLPTFTSICSTDTIIVKGTMNECTSSSSMTIKCYGKN